MVVVPRCPIGTPNWNTAGLGWLPALPLKFTVRVNGSVEPHGAAASTENTSAVAPLAEPPAGIVGYATDPCWMTAPDDPEVNVADTAVADAPPPLRIWIETWAAPRGATPPPPIGVIVMAPRASDTAGLAPALFRALNADRTPRPLLRSAPCSSTSIEPVCNAVRSLAGVRPGITDLMSAATAPAWGAAAEVPKNGFSPERAGSVVVTPSAADRSGLTRLTPPRLADLRPGFFW